MSNSKTAQPISLFCSQISNGSFGDETLRLLDSLLVCKDVESLTEVQLSLTEFLRSKSVTVLREITEKTFEQKLEILEFFIRAFALLGDIESCLALKYEALLLREIKLSSCQSLRVSYVEWLNFAEQLLQSGFYPNARQACENALLCLQKDDVAKSKAGQFSEEKRIKRLMDEAMKFSASNSVQSQAADYLKRKTVEKSKICYFSGMKREFAASSAFRNGVKKRNVRQLYESQRLQQKMELQR